MTKASALAIALLLTVMGCTSVTPDSGGSSSGGSSSGGAPQGNVFGIYTQAYPLSFLYDIDFNNNNLGGKYGKWGTGTILTDDTSDFPPVSGCRKSTAFVITNYDGGVYWLFCSNQSSAYAPVDVDLGSYASGYLHFWIKATNDIMLKLESSNQTKPAFQWLSRYVTINSSPAWQEVNVPLSDFSGTADFTKLNIPLGLHSGKGTYKLAELYYKDNGSASVNTACSDNYSPGLGWELVWSDEFNETGLDSSKWVYDTGKGPGGDGWGNSEWEYYTSRETNVFVRDGKLTIRALKESYSGSSFTSGRIKTLGKYSFQYGRIAAKIKLPSGRGMFPAFWMMGTNLPGVGWPACGEIDILEMAGGGEGDYKAYGTIHGGIDSSHHFQFGANKTMPFALGGNFHVYVLEWEPGSVRMTIDGVEYDNTSDHGISSGPFFILLNLAVGGNCGGSGWPGYPDSSTIFPQTMEVDWVRVYQRNAVRPQIFINYPITNAVIYGNFVCGGTASAANGLSQVMVSIDGGTYVPAPGSASWNTNLSLPLGSHTISAYSIDVSNQTSWTDTVALTVVNTPPVFTATYIPPYGSSDTVRGTLSGVSPSEYYISTHIYVPPYGDHGWWSKPADSYTAIKADGTWEVYYAVAGNDTAAQLIQVCLVSRATKLKYSGPSQAASRGEAIAYIRTNRVDTTPPVINVTSPASSVIAISGTTCTFAGTAQDDSELDGVYLSQNGGAFTYVPETRYIQLDFVRANGCPQINWTTNLTLTASVNHIKVFSKDFGGNVSVTNDITIYANGPSYTVNFDSQEGSAVTPQTVLLGCFAAVPGTPTKTGYALEGWFKDTGYTDLWHFSSDTVMADITLYAKWLTSTPGLAFTLINGNTEYSAAKGTANTTGSVIIPAYWAMKKVTSIDGWAFDGCSGLTSLTIPSAVVSIGNYAFHNCSSLKSLVLPNGVSSIGDSMFMSCSGLTNLTLPSGLTSIGYRAFYGCSGLTNITLPSGVSSIGNIAFYNCSGLRNLNMERMTAPALGTTPFSGVTGCILHIHAGATGYDSAPWTDTSIFSSIVEDL